MSNADGETPVYLYADPTTHGLVVAATIDTTGLATSANQSTEIASLATIATNTTGVATAANQTTMAGNQTNGTQQAKLTDGTNIANTLKSDGTAAGQNALLTGGTGYTTSTVSLSAGTQSSSWYDMLNYSSVSVGILTNTTPATISWQTSSDAAQTNIRAMVMTDSSSAINTPNTTTTPTSSTAYVSSIVVCVETAGTTSTLDIRDKSGTPIYLVRTLSTAALLGNGEITYNFQTPIKMTAGIDIITAGAAAATVNVFVNYFQ